MVRLMDGPHSDTVAKWIKDFKREGRPNIEGRLNRHDFAALQRYAMQSMPDMRGLLRWTFEQDQRPGRREVPRRSLPAERARAAGVAPGGGRPPGEGRRPRPKGGPTGAQAGRLGRFVHGGRGQVQRALASGRQAQTRPEGSIGMFSSEGRSADRRSGGRARAATAT